MDDSWLRSVRQVLHQELGAADFACPWCGNKRLRTVGGQLLPAKERCVIILACDRCRWSVQGVIDVLQEGAIGDAGLEELAGQMRRWLVSLRTVHMSGGALVRRLAAAYRQQQRAKAPGSFRVAQAQIDAGQEAQYIVAPGVWASYN